MIKRSLALGALMAFVITGSAMAAEVNATDSSYTGNNTETLVYNGINLSGNATVKDVAGMTFTGDSPSYLAVVTTNGTITLENVGAIKTDNRVGNYYFFDALGGTINVTAESIDLNVDGYGIVTQHSSGQAGKVDIETSGDINMTTGWNAIYVSSIQGAGIASSVSLKADNITLANVKNEEWYGDYKFPTVLVTSYIGNESNSTVTLEAEEKIKIIGETAVAARNGASDGSTVVTLTADNVELIATEKGISAENNGTVNVDAAKTTIITNNTNGLSYGIDARYGSSVNVTGDLVIDAKSTDDYAAGVYSVYDGDVTIGTATDKSDVTIKATCVDKNENQDAGWDNAYGVYAYSHTTKGNNGEVKIFADELNITVDGAYAYGVMSCSNVDTKDGKSSVVIDANKTKITVTSDVDGNAAAMTAFSGSELIVKGDLEATADNVVLTRGNATVKINESAKNTVNLTGDILFARAKAGSAELIDADVLVNLVGEYSTFKGNILVENGEKEEISGMKLGLFDGATWTVTDNSFVNNLTANEGKIAFADNGHVDVDAGSGSLVLTEDVKTADDLNDAAGLTTVAQRLGVSKEATETISAKVVMAEGDIKGETTGVVTFVASAEDGARVITAEGNIDDYYYGKVTEVTEKVNTKNQAIGDAGISLKLHWRSHINDMNKRMGELRNAEGEHGVWARMVRGESEYKNTKAQYNQYQLGYDEKLSVDKRWTVGAAVTFADGDASYGQGTTEDKSTAFAIYGSKLNNDGTFVDLIARYAHLESDMEDANSGKGDYATNGMSVSAEFGKRIQHGNGLWVEPQVELTYGTIDSAEFKFDSGKAVQVGDMDSLIGRVGFRIGKDLEQGNVYARASYLYDFDGETENAFSNGTDSRTIAEDLGGGWWEVGVGANINLSKATYIYADVEKTFGGEVDTNWQWNLGVRYSF